MLVLSCLPLHNRGPRDSSEPRLWTQSIGLCTGDSRWRRPTLRLALHSSYISRRLCCIRDVLCLLVIPWPRTCPAISHVPVFPLQIFLSNPDMRNSSSLYIFLRTCILFCRRISFQEEEKHSWHSEPVSRLKTRARVGLHTVFFSKSPSHLVVGRTCLNFNRNRVNLTRWQSRKDGKRWSV